MLGNWIRRKIQRSALRAQTDDIERFITSLRGQSDDEMGMVVALATIIRCNLREQGMLPDEAFGNGLPLAPIDQAFIPVQLNRLIRSFQKAGQFSDAAGTMVWLHSARAISTPELRLLGRQMWGQLRRGFPHVMSAFFGIRDITGKMPGPLALVEYRFIPPLLEPFE